MKQAKAAAVLTIRDAAKMTPRGRLAIGRWLQLQGANLVANGKQLSARYTARYLYR